MSLEGKTVIVTGSSWGLGKDIAEMYLSKGCNVVVCDINHERLAEAATHFESAYPDKVLIIETNVTDEDSVKKLVSSAVEKFGKLDIVVNNAGILDHFDPAGSCDKGLWDRVMAVDVTGPFLVTKHAVQVMEKQGHGLVVNIGSNASHRGFSAGVAYTTSKHAIIGLTKNTATYYGPKGVNCLALLLGGMETTHINDAFATGINKEGMGYFHATMPGYVQGKTGLSTELVARYIGFLSEDEMSTTSNGSCIVFNKNWPVA
ncbi:short chain dehydrogenase [Fusarium albosuccineum]|uniref:Short chain dehydrogenase n=1 Tax=Fusarium albosuccineum TaxID=1237068 RepID=A0A8H4PGL3_9HYPO|nr:short chain dehydrogenase [Fusarium albosuccineum]